MLPGISNAEVGRREDLIQGISYKYVGRVGETKG